MTADRISESTPAAELHRFNENECVFSSNVKTGVKLFTFYFATFRNWLSRVRS